MDTNKIMAAVFEESRKMPNKDQRVNLNEIRAELDIRIGEAIDDLNRIKLAQGEFKGGKSYGFIEG